MTENTGYAGNPPWGLFPPYGFMNDDDMSVVMNPVKPKAWRGSQASYDNWFNGSLNTIRDLLWPVFDEASKTWVGPSAPWMEELTRLDLTLMRKLYTSVPEAIDEPVQAPDGLQPLKTHHDLFSEEDLHVTN